MALAWEDLSDLARKPELIKHHTNDRLWQLFGPLVRAKVNDQPFVIAQLGQSLDGRIATTNGHSHYINGSDALDHLHRLRALVDGIVVGAGTVQSDNPSLTVRRVTGENPARIVIDPNRRVDMNSQIFVDDGVPVIIVGPSRPDDPVHLNHIAPDDTGAYPPDWIARQLALLGKKQLLIEGGAATVSGFVSERCIHRLHILTGPLIIGSGPTGLNMGEITNLDGALRPQTRAFPFDSGDVLFDCDFTQHHEGES